MLLCNSSNTTPVAETLYALITFSCPDYDLFSIFLLLQFSGYYACSVLQYPLRIMPYLLYHLMRGFTVW